jgi:hypothetical protein
MITTIEERIREHLPEPNDTLACFKCFRHESWEDIDKDTGELIGFVAYFFLDFEYDMIIAAAKDNSFSKEQWRVLKHTIGKRVKPIRIQSDPNNKVLHRAAKSFGGYFSGGDLYFPI